MAIVVPQYTEQGSKQAVSPTRVVAPEDSMNEVARGLGAVSVAADRWDEELATAEAKEADANFTRQMNDILYGDGGYLTTSGGNAAQGMSGAQDAIKALHSETYAGLRSRAQSKASSSLMARQNAAIARIGAHGASQRRTYLNDTSTARITAAVETAVYDPTQVSQSLSMIDAETREIAAREGWSADVTGVKLAAARSSVHEGVVKRISTLDPQAAIDYLRNNRDDMIGSEVASLEATLVPMAKEFSGREAARTAFNSANDPSGVSAATDMLVKFEGFSESAYYDVTAHRAGHGSDTVTRADGSIVKVTPDTVVSKADAARDLSRRIETEFMPKAMESAGAAWIGMNPQQKAVLTSLAYNYGSVPDRVSGVIQRGGTTEEIAAAIRALGSDNDGANARRRGEEANAFAAGGNGMSYSDAAQITDPVVRDAYIQEMDLQIASAEKDRELRRQTAQDEVFRLIESGGSLVDLPVEVRQNMGQGAVSSLRSYETTVKAGRAIETDDEFYVDLLDQYNANPASLASQDPMEWRDKLSDADFDKFLSLRSGVFAGARNARVEAGTAPTPSNLMTQADAWLQSSGISKKDKPKQYAKFQSSLIRWADANPELANDPVALNSQVKNMLSDVEIHRKGFNIKGDAYSIDFDGDAYNPKDDVTIEDVRRGLSINGSKVSPEMLADVARGFADNLGRAPTPEELVDAVISTGLYE